MKVKKILIAECGTPIEDSGLKVRKASKIKIQLNPKSTTEQKAS
jgi:hypothetical protein